MTFSSKSYAKSRSYPSDNVHDIYSTAEINNPYDSDVFPSHIPQFWLGTHCEQSDSEYVYKTKVK